MAMMTRLFVALTTNAKRYSGTKDTFNLTIDKGAEKLADVNFGTGIEDGEGFVWNIPVGTFESDDATLMTFALRGNDLLRPTALVVWGDTGAGSATVPALHVSDRSLIGTEVSTDAVEGTMVAMLPRTPVLAANALLDELVVVSEAWLPPGAGFGSFGPLVEIRVTRPDGSLLAAEALVASDTLSPGEAGIWYLNPTAPFRANEVGTITLRNLSAASGAVRSVLVIGRGDSTPAVRGVRALAWREPATGAIAAIPTGASVTLPPVTP
jgi:hypothetical protein